MTPEACEEHLRQLFREFEQAPPAGAPPGPDAALAGLLVHDSHLAAFLHQPQGILPDVGISLSCRPPGREEGATTEPPAAGFASATHARALSTFALGPHSPGGAAGARLHVRIELRPGHLRTRADVLEALRHEAVHVFDARAVLPAREADVPGPGGPSPGVAIPCQLAACSEIRACAWTDCRHKIQYAGLLPGGLAEELGALERCVRRCAGLAAAGACAHPDLAIRAAWPQCFLPLGQFLARAQAQLPTET
ncbi:hypothetical protein H696_02683 [Fonticula alba]|uniref:Mitochondrial inner membrane protease ATP23 n=1 Tax=Fonticula alba TaxID=691883 RepID=A0A058Z8A5_FONAL|nr:hypothetical protein H696_02683 [Fonticula alba]KCV70356.1 hypothetical protein H696_02683 [Fonticula alba]|eukprot:XP_009494872.1 hypothetical protein H696_02683 [Fonticula alba]